MAVSANIGGWIADSLVRRGTSVTVVRKVPVSSIDAIELNISLEIFHTLFPLFSKDPYENNFF